MDDIDPVCSGNVVPIHSKWCHGRQVELAHELVNIGRQSSRKRRNGYRGRRKCRRKIEQREGDGEDLRRMNLSRRWLCLRISEAIVGNTAAHLSADKN